MKKLVIVCTLLIFGLPSLECQVFFMKRLDMPASNEYICVSTCRNGDCVAGSKTFGNGQGFISRYDSLGTTLWFNELTYGTLRVRTQKIIECADSGFVAYACAPIPNSVNGLQYFLYKCDFAGNFIWSIIPDSTNELDIRDIFISPDSSIFMIGIVTDTTGQRTYIARVSQSGNLLSERVLGEYLIPFGCCRKTDSTFVVGLQGDFLQNSNKIVLITLKSNLDISSIIQMKQDTLLFHDGISATDLQGRTMIVFSAREQANLVWHYYFCYFDQNMDPVIVRRTNEVVRGVSGSVSGRSGILLSAGGEFKLSIVDTSGSLITSEEFYIDPNYSIETWAITANANGGFTIGGDCDLPGPNYDHLLIRTDASGYSGCYSFFEAPLWVSDSILTYADSVQLFSFSLNYSSPLLSMTPVTLNEYFLCNSLEIEQHTIAPAAELTVYPNPAQGFLCMESTNTLESVQIFDVRGALVLSKEISANNPYVDISQLSNGVYFISILTSVGELKQKFVISR